MMWGDVTKQKIIYLNLGGNGNCHPKPGYEGYIAIDINPGNSEWAVNHDLRKPVPLQRDSVDRILSEDFFEHVTVEDIKSILCECSRILKPGGLMRIGVPDYCNPKDRPYLEMGMDPRYPLHVTLTTYDLMKRIIIGSPFKRYKFWHYWDRNLFVYNTIDYSVGMVKRTPDNDMKCKRAGLKRKIKGALIDIKFIASRGLVFDWQELQSQEGHRLHVTSLVVDLYKD